MSGKDKCPYSPRELRSQFHSGNIVMPKIPKKLPKQNSEAAMELDSLITPYHYYLSSSVVSKTVELATHRGITPSKPQFSLRTKNKKDFYVEARRHYISAAREVMKSEDSILTMKRLQASQTIRRLLRSDVHKKVERSVIGGAVTAVDTAVAISHNMLSSMSIRDDIENPVGIVKKSYADILKLCNAGEDQLDLILTSTVPKNHFPSLRLSNDKSSAMYVPALLEQPLIPIEQAHAGLRGYQAATSLADLAPTEKPIGCPIVRQSHLVAELWEHVVDQQIAWGLHPELSVEAAS